MGMISDSVLPLSSPDTCVLIRVVFGAFQANDFRLHTVAVNIYSHRLLNAVISLMACVCVQTQSFLTLLINACHRFYQLFNRSEVCIPTH